MAQLFDTNLLYTTMSVQTTSMGTLRMERHVLRHAARAGATVTQDEWGNIYATKAKGDPETVPCVVAHMDTVHDLLPSERFVIQRHADTWYAFDPVKRDIVGIGGDDKVGVFVALTMLYTLDTVKAAFFVDEEIGCIGASKADLAFFDDVSWVLECDRRGYGDFVISGAGTQLSSWPFEAAMQPILKDYNFTPTWGSITDVVELKERGLAVAVANLSCGYYMPHTSREYIVIPEVEAVTNLVYDACTKIGDQLFTHVAPKTSWTSYDYGSYTSIPKTSGNVTKQIDAGRERIRIETELGLDRRANTQIGGWAGTYDWEYDLYSWERDLDEHNVPIHKSDSGIIDVEDLAEDAFDDDELEEAQAAASNGAWEQMVAYWLAHNLPCPECKTYDLLALEDESNLYCQTCDTTLFKKNLYALPETVA